ncbi:MAG TPA: ACT domain-containing protein [Methanomassiliicoccales archaeon]|nr:ACT domain-containing protein [Methanomassiliicoccales archaeon]
MTDHEKYRIKQLSIFSENRPGRLMDIAGEMKVSGVDILGFTIAEGSGYGVVRMLVDKPDKAHEALAAHGHVVKFTEVLAVRMEDRPGGLYDLTVLLRDAGINIEYAYGYRSPPNAVLIIKVEDIDRAIDAVLASGRQLCDKSHFR